VFQRQRGDWQPATRLRDKLISLRRAISNGWRAPAAFLIKGGLEGWCLMCDMIAAPWQ